MEKKVQMNDIEKAIETIKRISDLDIKYHLGIDSYDLLTAIEALRDKQEREHRRELCETNSEINRTSEV